MGDITEFHQMTMDEYIKIKEDLRRQLNFTAESFVKIGYFLKQIRDTEAFRQDGYENIFEFAQKEHGLSKSVTSRFMSINDKYSVGGSSEELREEFIGYGSSRLSEMLTMDPEDYCLVDKNTPVTEIREIKRTAKTATGEERTNLQEVFFAEYRDKKEELNDICKATSMEDVREEVLHEGYRLMKKGVLAVKFEEAKIIIRQLGVTGKQELSWEDFIKEMATIFNFNSEDPWTEAYGVEETEKKTKEHKVEKKKKPVATSQQKEETETEEQVPGQKNIADYEGAVPETEPFDPSPEKIVSKCYDCLNWEKCSEKGEAVDYCLDYKNKNTPGAMSERELQEVNFMNQPETQTVDTNGEIHDRRVEHDVKTESKFFKDSKSGIKPFELRKNDRDYKAGDFMKMREYKDGEWTGEIIRKEITYVLEDFEGLKPGYCILGVKDA